MLKKKINHESQCPCYMIVIFSIVFLINFIYKQVCLQKIIPDNEEQKSGLTVQYYDQEMANKSFISFTKFNPDLLKTKVFTTDMTNSKWIPKNARILLKNHSNALNNKCQKCGTEYQNPSSNSSERDLVISYFYDLSVFKLRFISALRAARCQATIVLFVSDPANDVIQPLRKITDNCGVIIINIKNFDDPFKDNKEISYHILFHEFLKEFRSDFDRVVILNPSVIIAQSDPFTTYFTYSTVGITTLNYNEKISNDQAQIVNSIDTNSNIDYINKGPYLSSSILYGSVDGILMFYGILFSHKDFKEPKIESELTISGYINYFYHNGLFEKQGLKLFVAISGNFICSVEKTEELLLASKIYYASPLDLKRKVFFTTNFYRERQNLHRAGRGMNPPSIIGLSENDPLHSVHYLSCTNIPYKSKMKTKQNPPAKRNIHRRKSE